MLTSLLPTTISNERLFRLTDLKLNWSLLWDAVALEQEESNPFQGRENYILKHNLGLVLSTHCSNYKHLSNLSAYFMSCFSAMMSGCSVTRNMFYKNE